jgi:hypothetical protein
MAMESRATKPFCTWRLGCGVWDVLSHWGSFRLDRHIISCERILLRFTAFSQARERVLFTILVARNCQDLVSFRAAQLHS